MKKALGFVVVALLMGIAVWLNTAIPSKAYNEVTLKAPRPGQQVQMFAFPGSGDDAFADFPGGTPCTILSGPTRTDFGGGISSDYYKLTCHGVTGHVNVKWVSP